MTQFLEISSIPGVAFLGSLSPMETVNDGGGANYSDPSNAKFEKSRCDLGYSQSFALSSKVLTNY